MVAGRADGLSKEQVTESMKKKALLTAGVCFLSFLTLGTPVFSQEPSQESGNLECTVPIYTGKDLDQKPRIVEKPPPNFTSQEHEKYQRQVIMLRAILCGSGTVTDITVKNGLSNTVDAKAIEAARRVKFVPGKKDGQNVSRFVTLLYRLGV
jgi:TonB family protein